MHFLCLCGSYFTGFRHKTFCNFINLVIIKRNRQHVFQQEYNKQDININFYCKEIETYRLQLN